ncbi:PQQ-binding-like beta-propeller repeat protein [Verrucomicrobiaceae bacterium 227]
MSRFINKHWAILLCLLLASCEQKAGVEVETSEPLQQGGAGVAVVKSDWPLARGGAGLSGQVGLALPMNPEVKWTFKTTGSIIGETVVSQGIAVFGDSAGFLTAVDVTSGEKKWQKEFDQSFEAAPAIFEDTIYIGCEDTFFYALDLASGDEKWSIETNDKITAAVNVTKSPDGSEMWVILNGYDGVCRAIRASNGEEVWIHETPSPINGTPAIVDGKFIVFGGCDQFLYTLDLATGKALKQIEGEAPIVSTVGTEGSFVAWGNHANQVSGADINSDKPTWIYSDRAFPFMSAPAVDTERVYVGGRDKKIHAISRDKGEKVWTYKTGSRVESSPLLFLDGLLVGSSDGRLYALTLDEGKEIWTLDLGEALIANASFAHGMILIGSEGGTLFAISAK